MKSRILATVLSALAAVLVSGCFGANAKDAANAPPAASIPTFPTDNIGREGHFYVGGHYQGEPGKEIMFGAMYVEVMVPRKIQHPYPIVFICGGAGQTAVTVLQTPDGRPGWAYDFLNQGYTVYVMDYPGRGRSLYFSSSDADGKLAAPRTSPLMEEVWSGAVRPRLRRAPGRSTRSKRNGRVTGRTKAKWATRCLMRLPRAKSRSCWVETSRNIPLTP